MQSVGWDQVQHPVKETAPAGTEEKEARLRRTHPQLSEETPGLVAAVELLALVCRATSSCPCS